MSKRKFICSQYFYDSYQKSGQVCLTTILAFVPVSCVIKQKETGHHKTALVSEPFFFRISKDIEQ